MDAVWGYAGLLAAPLVVLAIVLVVAWRQDRRRRWTQRRAPGLRRARWGLGSVSRTFGQPERPGSRRSGTGAGQGPDDRPTYLD